MKSILCTLCYCLIFSLLTKAQDYKVLIEQGDSLFKIKKFDSSFYTYEEAIELIKQNNTSVTEETWLKLFIGAANSAAAGANKEQAHKYWNLAKGGRGEKISDKINALVTSGQNSITISKRINPQTKPIYLQECNIDTTTYLMWAEENSVFVQKFDNCRNYAPFQFNNQALYAIIRSGTKHLKLDSMTNVNNHGYHEPVFKIGIYTQNSILIKLVKDLDITDPNTKKPQNANIAQEVSLKNYKTNSSTSLYKLLVIGNLQIKEYESKLGSPSERLKAGSL